MCLNRESGTLRGELIGLSLGIPTLLSSADKILVAVQEKGNESGFFDCSLHLLTKFEQLQTKFIEWLNVMSAKTPGPLYWPRS